jgi:hypothetical protein
MKLNEVKYLIRKILTEQKINKNYTHFAIRKNDNKIVNAWDYSKLDNESINDYYKQDIKDQFPDEKLSNYSLKTKKYLESKNINPFDSSNWSN